MQLFDFRCTHCNHKFEDWDTIDKAARPQCPKCHAPDAMRLISKLRIDYTGIATSGVSSDDGMTTSVEKWAKARAEKVIIEERNMRNHGTVD